MSKSVTQTIDSEIKARKGERDALKMQDQKLEAEIANLMAAKVALRGKATKTTTKKRRRPATTKKASRPSREKALQFFSMAGPAGAFQVDMRKGTGLDSSSSTLAIQELVREGKIQPTGERKNGSKRYRLAPALSGATWEKTTQA
jgi:hypothetical protein